MRPDPVVITIVDKASGAELHRIETELEADCAMQAAHRLENEWLARSGIGREAVECQMFHADKAPPRPPADLAGRLDAVIAAAIDAGADDWLRDKKGEFGMADVPPSHMAAFVRRAVMAELEAVGLVARGAAA